MPVDLAGGKQIPRDPRKMHMYPGVSGKPHTNSGTFHIGEVGRAIVVWGMLVPLS